MKIFDLLWWFFGIGNEPTAPDIQRKAGQEPDQQQISSATAGLDQDLLQEPDFCPADLDEFEL